MIYPIFLFLFSSQVLCSLSLSCPFANSKVQTVFEKETKDLLAKSQKIWECGKNHLFPMNLTRYQNCITLQKLSPTYDEHVKKFLSFSFFSKASFKNALETAAFSACIRYKTQNPSSYKDLSSNKNVIVTGGPANFFVDKPTNLGFGGNVGGNEEPVRHVDTKESERGLSDDEPIRHVDTQESERGLSDDDEPIRHVDTQESERGLSGGEDATRIIGLNSGKFPNISSAPEGVGVDWQWSEMPDVRPDEINGAINEAGLGSIVNTAGNNLPVSKSLKSANKPVNPVNNQINKPANNPVKPVNNQVNKPASNRVNQTQSQAVQGTESTTDSAVSNPTDSKSSNHYQDDGQDFHPPSRYFIAYAIVFVGVLAAIVAIVWIYLNYRKERDAAEKVTPINNLEASQVYQSNYGKSSSQSNVYNEAPPSYEEVNPVHRQVPSDSKAFPTRSHDEKIFK